MNETNYQELYEKVRDVAFATRRALANTAAPMGHVERAKNLLYNNMAAIEDALKFAVSATKQIQLLEMELADAERELDEKDRELKAAAGKKTTGRKKTAEVADE